MIVSNDIISQQIALFTIEKEYFQELIKNSKFLKKNKVKYIAIKGDKILGIGSNFTEIVKDVFKDKNNIGKTFITLITEEEMIAHFDSPLYTI